MASGEVPSGDTIPKQEAIYSLTPKKIELLIELLDAHSEYKVVTASDPT